ncbi:MAG TPA: ABC transporter substrate-binding protein [Gryllotalpicola sp.]
MAIRSSWRRRLRRGALALPLTAALAAAALSLSGCVAKPPASATAGGSASTTLNVAAATAPTTLDPASQCTLQDSQLTSSLYVQLLQYDAKPADQGTTQIDPTKVKPYFAKSWEASSDGKTYTFTLQSGWTFPDGKPMDATAMKYSLERTNTINSCGSAIINDLYQSPNLISSVDAPDATTLVIHLLHPDSAFLLAMATPAASVVEPSLIDANGGIQAGKPNTWAASHSTGGGPFLMKSYTPGTSAVLSANPDFKGDAPGSKTINVKWISSDPTLLLQAKNGQSDVTIGLADNSAKSLEGASDVKVVAYTGTANMQFLMPNNKAPWNNEKLREAVTYAIPYKDIADKVIDGFGKLYYGPIPPTMPGYAEQYSSAREQDVAKAKQLVADSGVKTPVNVTLTVLAGDNNQASIATILQGSLKDIGINLTIQSLDASAWGDAVYNGKAQSALRLDGPAVFSAGYYLQYDEDCDSSYNTGHICVPANTELLKTARAATDEASSNAAYAQLTKNWVDVSPKAILYLDGSPVVINKSVSTFFWSPEIDMRTWKK